MAQKPRPKLSVNYFVIPESRAQVLGTRLCSDADGGGPDRSGAIMLPIKAAASGAQRASSRENDAPCPPQRRPIFSKTRCARQVEQLSVITCTPRSWMAFAAGEQGRHAALLHALCHREQQAVGSTALLQTRVSEAALGSARLHARVASCLHGVSRH